MFTRPHKVSPHCRVAEVDRTFTSVCKNLVDKPDTPSTTSSGGSVRSGDGASYSVNANVAINLPQRASRQMFRILSYTEDSAGRRVFFDMIDGRVYGRGPGLASRTSSNVVLFETKEAALSERFPSNQVYATKGGNGLFPRILVSFDAWGEVRKRHGGGAALVVQNAKIMKLVQFLDPPHPVSKRLCDRYVEPFFFTPADRQKPNRMTSPQSFKINRLFDLRLRSKG